MEGRRHSYCFFDANGSIVVSCYEKPCSGPLGELIIDGSGAALKLNASKWGFTKFVIL